MQPCFSWHTVKINKRIYDVYLCGKFVFTQQIANEPSTMADCKMVEAKCIQIFEKKYGALAGSRGAFVPWMK